MNTVINLNCLKQKRIEKHFFQKDIAKIIGVSSKMYSAMERGERGISLARAKILAGFFNTTVEKLFFT